MQVIEQLRQEIAKKGLSVLKVSNQTGISAYKIYKWLDGKAKPKHEDSLILEKWLRKCEEEIPIEETETQPNMHTEALIKTLQEHNETLKGIIQSNLTALNEGIAVNRELLAAVLNGVTARSETIMSFLERLAKMEPGSLVSESDRKEIELKRKQNQKDKISDANKSHR